MKPVTLKQLAIALAILLSLAIGYLVVTFTNAIGQTAQRQDKWARQVQSASDVWKVRENYTLNDSLAWIRDNASGDTLFSEIFLVWPLMSVRAVVGDTSSAPDSINFRVDFLQCTSKDSAKFTVKKTLWWTSGSSATETQTINAAGYWDADITADAINTHWYGRFRIVKQTGNKKLTGNWATFNVTGAR